MSLGNSLGISCNEKTIHWRRNKTGWALVIMPDSIRIDDNHGYCHIHLKCKQDYHTIQDDSFEAIYQKIVNHIVENNEINMDKLKKELKF